MQGFVSDDRTHVPDDAPRNLEDDYLTIPQIAKMYGVQPQTVRHWKLTPAFSIPFGRGRMNLYRRADVVAYANRQSRLNRRAAQIRDRQAKDNGPLEN